ncbi:hypothetical protein WYO_1808 [Methylobacterium sp. GXF4]|uniref:hypothetical protein n=1 Tax=Methylobacterium sp. GXF4 TaxID=1096546 RepID=UPI0002697C61|nr:hypothetical protein [Methylobacterium sp. GXF4]EIZ85442.1 hypothetical protein WYO_1808 [Methylobacterium sp. GXF4]
MNSLIARLLGRRLPTSDALVDQIEAQKVALNDAKARAAASADARRHALDAGDNGALRAADEARDGARRDAEIAEHAIKVLEAALTGARETEERDAFQAEVAEARAAGDDLSEKIRVEYPRLATALADLLAGIEEHNSARRRLAARGRELGETIEIEEVEAFRRKPRLGRHYAGLGYKDLIDAIEHLPGLHAGDDSIRFVGFR